MFLNNLSAVEMASLSLHVAEDTKTDSKRKQCRQEAVAFGQNQNIICDSVPCQERCGFGSWLRVTLLLAEGYG